MDRSQTQRFCEAVLCELEERTSVFDVVPKTIYFGGGTPTALSTSQLEFLLGGFHQLLDLSALEEWTIEANPGSVSARKAALLCKLGVNRISLGVQSWDNALLKILGREHNAEQAEQSFHILREAGCSNINVDLMFGLPGQTARTMAKDPGENHIAAPRPHFRLLPYLRGGHGIFSAPVTRRTQSESRFRCGFL